MTSDHGPTVLHEAPSNSRDVSNSPTVLRASQFHAATSAPRNAGRDPAPRSVGQPDPRRLLELDPALARYVDTLVGNEIAAAYARGLSEGRGQAMQQLDSLTVTIGQSLEQFRSLTIDHRSQFTSEVFELAEAIATAVIDRTPHDGGRAVTVRVTEELDRIGAVPVTVRVHPEDLPVVAAATTGDDVRITPDPALQPGEVVLTTEWSSVERTKSTAWSAIRTALATDG